MKAAVAVMALALLAGCGVRPWNYDETDRISQVMAREGEEPAAIARERSVAGGELPEVAAYTRPVFVRPRDTQRRPTTVKGKRASVTATELMLDASQPKRAARARAPLRAKPD